MLFKCSECGKFSFDSNCVACGTFEDGPSETVPVDPLYYPEFQYQSQGFVTDIFKKGKITKELQAKLESVLRKYQQFETPYFVNYFHVGSQGMASGASEEITSFDLFQEVLIRLGFSELKEMPDLLRKLVMTTSFRFHYADFEVRTSPHIKDSLDETLRSWIGERGANYRHDLVLLLYYGNKQGKFKSDINYQEQPPLVVADELYNLRRKSELIYLKILVDRYQSLLEKFDPTKFITIYAVDAMDGYQFEDFLVKLFSTLGYSVEATKRSSDQGADLFAERFNKKIVIQAKNYTDNVGNSAVQQVLAAKQFYSCDDAMVVTNSMYTRSAKDLAEAGGVKLVDRNELQRYLDDYNRLILEIAQDAVVSAN